MGSKWASGAFQAIIAQMPPHDCYIETHLGSGAVMLRKPCAVRSIAVEIDGVVLRQFGKAAGAAGVPSPELYQMDCVTFLKGFDFEKSGRTLIYADPPYLHSTRSSRKRYRYEYGEADHVGLIEVLRSVPAFVMISGYPSPLYDELLGDWRTFEFQAMTRGGPRTEKLWMNFESKASHWGTFAGRSFTDRQRIKRKAQRWASKYGALPPGERVAILAALLQVEGEAR